MFKWLFINVSGIKIKPMRHQPKKWNFIASLVVPVLAAALGTSGCKNQESPAPITECNEVQAKPAPLPGAELDNVVILPEASKKSGKRAVIAVHGLGDSPENFSLLFKDKTVPAEVLLPRAPTRHGRGGSWFPVAIPVRTTPKDKLKSDVSAATTLLCQFIDSQKYKRKPVITGFSQGGILAFSVAVTCPEEIHAAVPVSGFLPLEIPKNKKIPPIFAFHGTNDKIVDFEWGKTTVKKLFDAKVDVKLYQFPGLDHFISEELHEQWFEVLSDLVE